MVHARHETVHQLRGPRLHGLLALSGRRRLQDDVRRFQGWHEGRQPLRYRLLGCLNSCSIRLLLLGSIPGLLLDRCQQNVRGRLCIDVIWALVQQRGVRRWTLMCVCLLAVHHRLLGSRTMRRRTVPFQGSEGRGHLPRLLCSRGRRLPLDVLPYPSGVLCDGVGCRRRFLGCRLAGHRLRLHNGSSGREGILHGLLSSRGKRHLYRSLGALSVLGHNYKLAEKVLDQRVDAHLHGVELRQCSSLGRLGCGFLHL
mmetsp:Transcript_13732/g.54344  ORF Transcript_13732/g.54344 Transcript_13732/m.54344 type:complete len:255 (+) Transcript_13732:1720-2484(+)